MFTWLKNRYNVYRARHALLSPQRKWGEPIGAIVAVLIVGYGLYWAAGRTINWATSPASEVVNASVNQDAAALALQALEQLRIGLVKMQKGQDDQGNMLIKHDTQIKSHTDDLKTLKAQQLSNPETLKGLQDEVKALKEFNARPPLQLTPTS